jgi:hypothetical protein
MNLDEMIQVLCLVGCMAKLYEMVQGDTRSCLVACVGLIWLPW